MQVFGAAILGITQKYLQATRFWGNSLEDWLYGVGALVLVWIVARTIHALTLRYLERMARRSTTEVDDLAAEVLGGTGWYFHAALAMIVAGYFVELSGAARSVERVLVVGFLAFQVGIWAQRGATNATKIWVGRHEGGHAATVAAGIRFISRIAIWALVSVVALANLGVEVSGVIAGLGVGGIAAALAVQGILGDLFAGLSMYFDRPFDIGDFIVIDTLRGNIDRIGLRTTRVRSLDGEQITVPNGDLVKSRIRNMTRLKERRRVFRFGIEYGTSVEKLERTKVIVREIIEARPVIRLDRVHFCALGSSSLDYEVVFFVANPEYAVFMDEQELIFLELMRRLRAEGIHFAFPTHTVHLTQPPSSAS